MFGVYVLIDDKNVLDAQKIFVSMALINILKTPLSQLPFAMSTTMQVPPSPAVNVSGSSYIRSLSSGMSFILQAVVSLKRLGKYLCQEELKPENVSRGAFKSGELDNMMYDSIKILKGRATD